LRSIDGFSQALEEDYASKLDKGGKDFINRIRAAAKKMSGLIDDMLILSRITRKKLHYKKVDLTKMANEITKDLKKVQPERKVEFKIQSRLNTVADEGMIRIVLENLIGNAYKFTRKNKNAKIGFIISNTNGRKAYAIRDNGVGFDMAYYDKLFSPFQRLHSEIEFKGTGIGLAIVQRIARMHHGKVWAESKVGEGATFYFTLKPKKEASSE
jgi:light-regulated signal transduction histidine kinase (bacteriophytochrome)